MFVVFFHLLCSHSNSNGNQWERSYKDNDTYTAPTSDRVERLGYSSSGYGSVNVISFNSLKLIQLVLVRLIEMFNFEIC